MTNEVETKPCPLSGEWRYSNRFIISNGTLRILRSDFDTNPSQEFVDEVMNWVVNRLNTRADTLPARPDVEAAAEEIVSRLPGFSLDLPWTRTKVLESVKAIISKHLCVPSGAGELIERAEAMRLLDAAAQVADPDGVIPPAQSEAYCRLAAIRNTLKSAAAAIAALPSVQPAASCGCRAVVEKMRDEWRRLTNPQPGWSQHVRAADEILAALPAPAEGEASLFAVFYDGETRPVAGFCLEQDAHRYAKEYSGGESRWEIRRIAISALEKVEITK